MPTQSNNICFKGQNFFIGIDVHARSWNVSIITENVHLKTFSQPPKAAALRSFLDSNYPGGNFLSAYEAGFCGFSAHYDLIDKGINNIVFNPADISDTAKERSRKTDSVDSRKIARNLRNGELKAIYVPTKEEMATRTLVRTRFTLVKEITRTKIRIKAALKYYGFLLSESQHIRPWTASFLSWINEAIVGVPALAQASINIQLDLLSHLQRQRKDVERKILELMRGEKYCNAYNLATSVPGVGFALASTLLAEICAIDRFKSTDDFASYLGFVPDTRSSGDNGRTTGMTDRCNHSLRSLIVEASWMAIKKDPALLSAFGKLTKRMSTNRAIIRIARKLINRIYSVLKNKQPYKCSVVR